MSQRKASTGARGLGVPIRSVAVISAALAFVFLSQHSLARDTRQVAHPRLAVLLVFDQLRGDLLERHKSGFSGGFSMLLNEGMVFENAWAGHAITLSTPGHASIATSSYPSEHGYAGGEYWGKSATGGWWYQSYTRDGEFHVLGAPKTTGTSPRQLQRKSVADWFADDDPGARTVVLAVGSDVSVPYGGRQGRDVYNFSAQTGSFTTSSYYRKTLPPWLEHFNSVELPLFKEASRRWDRLSVGDVPTTRADASPYENGGHHNAFPHVFDEHRSDEPDLTLDGWIKDTPFADSAMFALAKQAVVNEKLGRREHSDLLVLAVNSTDNVGHKYGPLSVEQFENLLQLDRALGEFLAFLDEELGRENYAVALTADHGVMNIPEHELDEGRPARRVSWDEIEALLDRVELAVEDSPDDPVAAVKSTLEAAPFVATAYSMADLRRADEPADHYAALYQRMAFPNRTDPFPLWTRDRERNHHPARYGVVARFTQNSVFSGAPAVHGSPYNYDRHIPVIFFGGGVEAGRCNMYVESIDVSTTLAARLGVVPSTDVDGRDLLSGLAPVTRTVR